jgi:hypothetical protein
MAPRTPVAFVEWLVARHPALAALVQAHMADYGEMLPHVLFGDVTRYAADLARRAADDPVAHDELRALLTDLDQALSTEDDNDLVENLVWVSFVENAQGVAGDPEEPLRVRLRSFRWLGKALSHYE